MNVVHAILNSVGLIFGFGTMLVLTALLALHYINLFQAVPKDALAAGPQWMDRRRCIKILAAVSVFYFVQTAAQAIHFKALDEVFSVLLWILFVFALARTTWWAAKILQAKQNLDGRLVRFARYVFWGTSVVSLLLVVGIAFLVDLVCHRGISNFH